MEKGKNSSIRCIGYPHKRVYPGSEHAGRLRQFLPMLANGGCETRGMPSAVAAYGVGDLRSPRPHRLGSAGGGVALGLMFHLRVDLRTEQDDDGGDP
jgi:hypothetical protein